MAIDFPSSPSNGTTYTYNGVTYVYNSTTDQWIVQGTGSSELYVLKTGDTMTGSLTTVGYSGTTGTFSGNVSTHDLTAADATVDTLTSNGAITAAGEIRAGDTDNAKTHAFVAASGWINAKRMDDPIDSSKLLFKGENKDGLAAKIAMDGTAQFSEQIALQFANGQNGPRFQICSVSSDWNPGSNAVEIELPGMPGPSSNQAYGAVYLLTINGYGDASNGGSNVSIVTVYGSSTANLNATSLQSTTFGGGGSPSLTITRVDPGGGKPHRLRLGGNNYGRIKTISAIRLG